MAIFNRFGQKIFYAKDPTTGWNGTNNDTMQPNGTYIYMVVYSDISGRYHEQKGTVVLLRKLMHWYVTGNGNAIRLYLCHSLLRLPLYAAKAIIFFAA